MTPTVRRLPNPTESCPSPPQLQPLSIVQVAEPAAEETDEDDAAEEERRRAVRRRREALRQEKNAATGLVPMYNRYNRDREEDLNDQSGSDLDDFLASDNEEESVDEVSGESTSDFEVEEEEEEELLEDAILAALPCTAQHIERSRSRSVARSIPVSSRSVPPPSQGRPRSRSRAILIESEEDEDQDGVASQAMKEELTANQKERPLKDLRKQFQARQELQARHVAETTAEGLYVAVEAGETNRVRELLAAEVSPLHRGSGGGVALHAAAAHGHAHCLAALVAAHKKRRLACNMVDHKGRTCLHLAMQRGHHACLTVLLKAARSCLTMTDQSGSTALHLALRAGHTRCVELWATSGGDVTARDSDGMTPLHLACEAGNAEAGQALLLAEPTLGRRKGGEEKVTALHVAAGQGKLQCVRLLLRSVGLEQHVEEGDADGATALDYAAGGGHAACVEVLLKEGKANPNHKDNQGATALHAAAASGHRGAIQALLEDPRTHATARDRRGWSPLLYADFKGNRKSVLLLLQHGGEAQIQLLGEVLAQRDSLNAPRAVAALQYIATKPEFHAFLNNLIRKSPNLLYGPGTAFLRHNPALLDLPNKQLWFESKLRELDAASRVESKQPKQWWRSSGALEVASGASEGLQLHGLRRSNLVESCGHTVLGLLELAAQGEATFPLGPLAATFEGEPGSGAGVTREFWSLLADAFLEPRHGLFEPVASGGGLYAIPLHSPANQRAMSTEMQQSYRLCGALLGLALRHGVQFDLGLAPHIVKGLLGQEPELDDLSACDQGLHQGLVWLREHRAADLDAVFTVDLEGEEVELVPGGKTKVVTDSNKKAYIDGVTRLKLHEAIAIPMGHLRKGLHETCHAEAMTLFAPADIVLLLSGLPSIDLEDWQRHTVYTGPGVSPEMELIVWFWGVVAAMGHEERARLLQFATGSSRVPPGGFKHLRGYHGPQRFTIAVQPGSKRGALPTASTCFNLLKLPAAPTKQALDDAIHIALRHGAEGFSFA